MIIQYLYTKTLSLLYTATVHRQTIRKEREEMSKEKDGKVLQID